MKTDLAIFKLLTTLNKSCTITFLLIVIAINSCNSTPTSESDYYKEGMDRGQKLATRGDAHTSKLVEFRDESYVLGECQKYATEIFNRVREKNQEYDEARRRAYNKGCIDGFKASDQWKAYNLGWERGWAFFVSVSLEADFDIRSRCEDYASDVFSHNNPDRISRDSRETLIEGCIDGYENNFDK